MIGKKKESQGSSQKENKGKKTAKRTESQLARDGSNEPERKPVPLTRHTKKWRTSRTLDQIMKRREHAPLLIGRPEQENLT